jgi:hypothetical protein
MEKFPFSRDVTELSHKEDWTNAQIVFEAAEWLVAHEQSDE